MISYAQNFEDVLLNRAFGNVQKGFYVDIGANDPVVDSVTKHFYDKGWSGINVEPGVVHGKLVEQRPRDINLKVAISDYDGSATFYDYPNECALSTLTPTLAIRSAVTQSVELVIRCTTLSKVLADYARDQHIHFLKIDVEGHEAQVINGGDWRTFRPEILVIEATAPLTNAASHSDWEPILLQSDYQFCHFDGLNRFYVRRESAHLAECFDRPINLFDRFTKFDPELDRILQAGNRERAEQTSKISQLEAEVASLLAEKTRAATLREHLQHRLQLMNGSDNEAIEITSDQTDEIERAVERLQIELDSVWQQLFESERHNAYLTGKVHELTDQIGSFRKRLQRQSNRGIAARVKKLMRSVIRR
jgi:FkbM family methyltransferase